MMDDLSLVKDNCYTKKSESDPAGELLLKENGSTKEKLLKENGLTEEKLEKSLTLQSRARQFMKRQNWKNIAATACLLMAVVTCSAAFSLMGPFFPQEVNK